MALPFPPHHTLTCDLRVGSWGGIQKHQTAFTYHPRSELDSDQWSAEATCPEISHPWLSQPPRCLHTVFPINVPNPSLPSGAPFTLWILPSSLTHDLQSSLPSESLFRCSSLGLGRFPSLPIQISSGISSNIIFSRNPTSFPSWPPEQLPLSSVHTDPGLALLVLSSQKLPAARGCCCTVTYIHPPQQCLGF